MDIYGAQAGNLALTAGASGGVYIAGGIAPKIISRLTDGRFQRAFRNKGKMSPYVETIPVQVVTDPDAPWCVLAGTTVTIDARLRARGRRPLVLLATSGMMTVTVNGIVDVSSRRDPLERGAGGNPAACGWLGRRQPT